MKFFKRIYGELIPMTQNEINLVCQKDTQIKELKKFLKNKNIDISILYQFKDNKNFEENIYYYEIILKVDGVVFSSEVIYMDDVNQKVYMHSY